MSEPLFIRPGYIDLLGRPVRRPPAVAQDERGHDEYVEWIRRGIPQWLEPETIYSDDLFMLDTVGYDDAREIAGLEPERFDWNNRPEDTEAFLRAFYNNRELCLVRVLKRKPSNASPIWAFQVVPRSDLPR